MADFIRPEVKAGLVRWREVWIGASLVLMGLYWVLNGRALLPTVGALLAVLGLVFVVQGWRRIRFPHASGGPGVVEVDERQITYLAAHGGAAISIDGLIRVSVETGAAGMTWVLRADDLSELRIPGDAKGAEGLFDALVALPGVNYDQAHRAAQARTDGKGLDSFLIWQKDKRALH